MPRRRLHPPISSACLWLAAAAALAQPAPQVSFTAAPTYPDRNLLKNADFSLHDGGGIAQWRFQTATPSNFDVGWAEPGRTAPGSAWLKTHTGSMSGYWYQAVPVKPGEKVLVLTWVRSAGGKSLLYLTGDVRPTGGQPYLLDERAMLTSIKSSPLAPVWLKQEYLRGPGLDEWTAVARVVAIPEGLSSLTVHIGSYFMRGEMWVDDCYAGPPRLDVQAAVQAPAGGALRRVRALTDKGGVLCDSGELAAGTARWQETLRQMDAEAGCVIETTSADGSVRKSPRFPPLSGN